MKRFPSEFADLVPESTLHALDDFASAKKSIRNEKMFWFPEVLSPATARASLRLLEKHFGDVVRPVKAPIPRQTIERMRRSYEDVLPKTVSNHSVILNSRRATGTKIAERIGLLDMLNSDSLRQLAEKICGFQLDDGPGCQIVCYRSGDYVGPHHDHHPEAWNLRNGYIDLHLTLATESVDHHWLVYETGGFLRNMFQVGVPSGLSVSLLPFWHYTTPLAPRNGARENAKRWLVLTSFSIKQGRRTRFARIN